VLIYLRFVVGVTVLSLIPGHMVTFTGTQPTTLLFVHILYGYE